MTIGALLTWDDGLCEEIDHPGDKDTYLVGRIRGSRRARRQVRIGAPDASLTAVSGMAAVRELCDGLGVIAALDAAVGSIKQRARGHSAGALLVGLAAVQVAGLGSTTAAGLARRISTEQWAVVQTGMAAVIARMLARLPAARREALLKDSDDRSGHH